MTILASVFIIGSIMFSLGLGTMAYFSDTETSTGNMFKAGTLDLTVDGADVVIPFTASNLKRDDSAILATWEIKNEGTIPGTLSICIANIVDHESTGDTEYERDGGTGELSGYLCLEGKVKGTGSTGKWKWFMGAANLPNEHNLNWLGSGRCWDAGALRLIDAGCPDPMEQGDTCLVRFEYTMKYPMNAPFPDGDWNSIQGDWVTFDIILHLDQVPP